MFYELDVGTKEVKRTHVPTQFSEERSLERIVASECLLDGGAHVSTVFICIDHGFGYPCDPILFETMVFGYEPFEDFHSRCSTYREAVLMHEAAVHLVLSDIRTRRESYDFACRYKTHGLESQYLYCPIHPSRTTCKGCKDFEVG